MIKESRRILVSQLVKNEGQVEWLGRNPRQWTKEDVDRTAHSIDEDPDFLDERPLLVLKLDDKHFLVFAGNLRLEGAKALKMRSVPSVVYYPVTEEDRQAVRRRALKDNGSFGKHDPDILANEWDDLPFETYGVKVFDRTPMENGSPDADKIPTNLDAPPKNAPFVCKITFPDGMSMSRFVSSYKDVLKSEYNCTISETGGEL